MPPFQAQTTPLENRFPAKTIKQTSCDQAMQSEREREIKEAKKCLPFPYIPVFFPSSFFVWFREESGSDFSQDTEKSKKKRRKEKRRYRHFVIKLHHSKIGSPDKTIKQTSCDQAMQSERETR